ncbi:MAG: TRAP-type C4-dicarboxylate transport system permease small subunit [Halioglobus sp.]|jgi:TRAP-type C4-dicarboxylate transport system permease small subunit
MCQLSSFIGTVAGIVRTVSTICLAILFILIIFQVAVRYFFSYVPFFTEEFARYAMIWMTLFAGAVSVRDNTHIRIDLLRELLWDRAPLVVIAVDDLIDFLSLFVFIAVAVHGLGTLTLIAGQTSDGVRFPLIFPYAGVPAAFFLAALFSIERILRRTARL